MATFVPYDRSQAFLLPPDLKEWLPGDDLAHFIVAAVERVPLASFKVNPQAGGRPQKPPYDITPYRSDARAGQRAGAPSL